MQQKYLWGAAAVVVLGAIAAFVGVDYAYHHPASILAKFGEAATFGGLNPNPLSDVSALLSGKGVRQPVIEARINHPAKSTVPIVSTGTEEETIEPIQVEAIPPATAEPPTSAEESEDRGGSYVGGEYHLWVQPKAVTPDEDQGEDAKPCEACPVMKMLRGLGNMCWGLSNTGLWEAAQDWGSKGGCSGCLEWYEYSTPERIPVMPTEIQQDEDVPFGAEIGPARYTHIIQLFSANAADVVTAVQKYIGDLIEMYPPTGTGTKCVCESLKHDIVLVAEPVTNKVVVNVPAAFYEELLQLIHQLDKEPVTDQSEEGCYHGCGQRCRTSCCPKCATESDCDFALTQAENLRQLQGEWRRFWLNDQPSHLTPDRVDGGIAPRTPGIDDQERVEKPQCQGCEKIGVVVGPPQDIIAYWDKELQKASDYVPGDETGKCLVGRMLLLASDDKPMLCEGTLTVALFDNHAADGSAALEEWSFDKETLKDMVHEDSMRMLGYTIVLPTKKGTPELTDVRLKLEFHPASGTALYCESGRIRIKHQEEQDCNKQASQGENGQRTYITVFPNRKDDVQVGQKPNDFAIGQRQLASGALLLECDKLKVENRQGADGNTSNVLQAENNVYFQTSDALGRADVVIVDTEKDTIVLKGSPGHPASISRGFSMASSMTRGQTMIYNRITGTITCEVSENGEGSPADRTDGGIAPRTTGSEDEEKCEKPLCQGCCREANSWCPTERATNDEGKKTVPLPFGPQVAGTGFSCGGGFIGFKSTTSSINGENKVEKPLDQGCCKDAAKLCSPVVGSGRKISVAFDNVPLHNCIDAFTGCPGENNIVVDEQAIKAAGIKLNQLVTVYFADLEFKTAIEVVLKQTGLKCVVDKNVITITTEEPAK